MNIFLLNNTKIIQNHLYFAYFLLEIPTSKTRWFWNINVETRHMKPCPTSVTKTDLKKTLKSSWEKNENRSIYADFTVIFKL